MFDTTFQSPGVQWYFCIFTLIIMTKALVRKKTPFFLNLVQLSQDRFVYFYFSEAQRPLQQRNLGNLQMRLHMRDTFKLVFFSLFL